MTYDFLEQLISVSFMGTVAIAVVIIIKRLLISKLSPKAHLFLWLPVVLRLVVLKNLTSPISVYNHIPSDVYESVYMTFTQTETQIQTHIPTQINYFFILWILGAVLCIVIPYVFYVRFQNQLKPDNNTDPVIEEIAASSFAMSRLKIMPNMFFCMNDISPMVIGFIKPKLLVPHWISEKLSPNQLEKVFLHEYIHLKRKDRFLNLFLILLCALYWFNPAVWVMASYIRRDIENVCDEQVLKIAGKKDLGTYGEALLDMAQYSQNVNYTNFVSPMASSTNLRIRFKVLICYDKKRIGASVLPLVLVISVAFLTGAMADETQRTAEFISGEFINQPIVAGQRIDDEQVMPDDVGEIVTTDQEMSEAKQGYIQNPEKSDSHAQQMQENRQDTEKMLHPEVNSNEESEIVNIENTPHQSGQSGLKPSQTTLPADSSEIQNNTAPTKVHTYSSQDAVARFSDDKSQSGFACNTGNIKIDTVGLISSDEKSLHGYFNVYKDGELVGDSIRAYVSSTPSSITFSEAEGDLDYSFNVKTKTIS